MVPRSQTGGGGERAGRTTLHTFSQMKSRLYSQNLQGNNHRSCQQICLLFMCIIYVKKPKIKGFVKEHFRDTSYNLKDKYTKEKWVTLKKNQRVKKYYCGFMFI